MSDAGLRSQRWDAELRVFWLCVGGGCLAGVGAMLYLWIVFAANNRESFTVSFVVVVLATAAVVGVIIGIAVGVVVSVAGYVSQRLRGSRTPGIVAATLGSCLTLAFVFGGLPQLIPYIAILAVVASVALARGARHRPASARIRESPSTLE